MKFDLGLWANSGDQIQNRTLHRTKREKVGRRACGILDKMDYIDLCSTIKVSVAGSVIVHLELEHTVHIRNLELNLKHNICFYICFVWSYL